ncbi:MAG: DUF1624 domain-containing protein [Pedosphaera sp.]|nr:DUF1624 domain-containing protein [Pedosphaera sp.]
MNDPDEEDTDFLEGSAGSSTGQAEPKGSDQRLVCLDALRGFDMFWIAGGSLVVSALNKVSDNGVFAFFKRQLSHVDWDGFQFYDLIFPLFVFITGVSLVFSLRKAIEREGRAAAFRRVLFRGVALFVLGLIYSGGFREEWPGIRVLGVLQRIALAYTGAATLFLLFPPGWLIGIVAASLLGYHALFEMVPIRNFKLEKESIQQMQIEKGIIDVDQLFLKTDERVAGTFEPGLNLANHLDYQYLPGNLYYTYYDPEGLLSTLPAVATCLLGVLCGVLLMRPDVTPGSKAGLLLLWGSFAIIGGYLWAFEFPIIKKLWSPSFVLVAGGWSMLLLAAFWYLIEILGIRWWTAPFVWVGMNSIAVYFAAQLLGFGKVASRLVGGDFRASMGAGGDVLHAFVAVCLLFAFARFLYRRKIFLRL